MAQDDESKFTLAELDASLVNQKDPVAKRTRCLYVLRQMDTDEAVQVIAKGMRDPSTLLSHEAAYVLGQMQRKSAVPYLTEILKDEKVPVITRHEAAEALAAIGEPDSLAVLEQFCEHDSVEISHTCHLAVARIKWVKENKR